MAKRLSTGKRVIAGAALVAALGGGAQYALDSISHFEGYSPDAYRDPVGIWTKCYGDTKDVTPGTTYTPEQCADSLNERTLELAEPVLLCVPGLVDQDGLVIASFVSMAYNIGPGAFCKSSVATKANAGDWKGACERMAKIYRTADGKELPGLVRRRETESAMCLHGLERAEAAKGGS